MIERRHIVGGGLAAGLAALAPGAAAEAGAPADDADVAGAVRELRRSVEQRFDVLDTRAWIGVRRVREQQRAWLKSVQKYPDFIEVGLDVWDSLHDWHVRFQQPLNVTRVADGRYVMTFSFTTVILRPEMGGDYIGPPFDLDATPRRE
jgi:hypothetical protein